MLLTLHAANLSAQATWSLGARSGVFIITDVTRSADFRETFARSAVPIMIDGQMSYDVGKWYTPYVGLEALYLQYTDGDFTRDRPRSSPYLGLRYGVAFDLTKIRAGLQSSVGMSHYRLAHRSIQSIEQNMIFSTLDIGFSYPVSESWAIDLRIPVGVHPVFTVATVDNSTVGAPIFDNFEATAWGLFLGATYTWTQ